MCGRFHGYFRATFLAFFVVTETLLLLLVDHAE